MEYCETITEKIEGVGFYSPSGHFSEVHLLLEPGSPNSGIRLENKIPHGLLDKKWQKQIMTVLKSNKLLGVLTNSPLTDIKITLIGGSQQTKYSHASDYRNAALRAVRQGLMKLRARNAVKILSAFNKVELEVEERHYSQIVALIGQNRGNVLAAMDKNKKIKMNITMPEENLSSFEKKLRLLTNDDYQLTIIKQEFVFAHHQQRIIDQVAYNPEKDLENSANAVSCPHASDDLIVPWNKVEQIVFYPMSKI